MHSLSLAEFLLDEKKVVDQLVDNTYPHPIPLINYVHLQDIPDNTLVRFRGMIQDMLDSEIYLERYVVKSTIGCVERTQDGRFRDTLMLKDNEDVDFESPQNVQGERRSLFLVSIPGLNDWASSIEKVANGEITQKPSSTSVSSGVKRPLDESEAMDTANSEGVVCKKVDSKDIEKVSTSPAAGLSAEYLLNSPLPNRPGKACLAKVYKDFDDFALNTLVEITGFLSVDPALDATSHEPTEFEELSEIQAANPPPSLIPRLHCIHVRPLTHANPLLATTDPIPPQESNYETYKDIQLALSQCLLGDAVAAEYLMCHLISTVYVRSELQTLGQMSLNISNIPNSLLPEYTNKLYEILELLLPVSHLLPLTLDNLNTLQFEPKKDYKTNKLTSGVLQLAPHTHLVLDETKLLAGRLEQGGVEAVASIAHLIKTQKLKSNFHFYNLEFNANVPILTLSEGKSMLPSDCHVSLKPEPDCVALISETFDAVKHYLQPKLTAIRTLLTSLKLAEFDMNAADKTMVQNEFVEMRRLDVKAGPDDLHALLVLSRYLGMSQGRSKLDAEMWERAKTLEAERKSRLAVKK